MGLVNESRPPQRIAVMGISGGGKSTVAAELGRALGLPVVHLDSIQWRTGIEADPDEFRAEELQAIARDQWVMDGNYLTSGAVTERLRRADAVVVVDANRWIALRRAARRYLRQRRGAMTQHGNPPRLSPEFVRWILNWRRNHPQFVESIRRHAPDTPLIVVRSREDLKRLTEELRSPALLLKDEPPHQNPPQG
jgi:adenylate kinase family enzyme